MIKDDFNFIHIDWLYFCDNLIFLNLIKSSFSKAIVCWESPIEIYEDGVKGLIKTFLPVIMNTR